MLPKFHDSFYFGQQSLATSALPLKGLQSPRNYTHQGTSEFNAIIFYHLQSFQTQYGKVILYIRGTSIEV